MEKERKSTVESLECGIPRLKRVSDVEQRVREGEKERGNKSSQPVLVVGKVDGDEDPNGRDCSNLTLLILCIGSEGQGKKGKGRERKGRERSPPNLCWL